MNITEDSGRTQGEIGIAAFFLVLLIILTLAGNTIVIIAATTYYKLKEQHSNMFIVNLAIADLCVALLVMFCSLVELIMDMRPEQNLLIGPAMCSIQCAMNYCLIVVSMMTLGFVSVDRSVHIVYPLRYGDIMTVGKIRALICWTWAQGIIIGFIPVCLDWIHYDYYELVCAINWQFSDAVTYVIVAFITCFLAPGLTMVICYSIIFKEIRNSITRIAHGRSSLGPKPTRCSIFNRSISRGSLFRKKSSMTSSVSNNQSGNHHQHTSTNQHKRIVNSLLVVVLVFFLCMTPFCVTKLTKVLKGNVAGWVNTVSTFVQLAASACNPFIYGIFRSEFRNAFTAQYNKVLRRAGCKSYMLQMNNTSTTCTTNNNNTVPAITNTGSTSMRGQPQLLSAESLDHSETREGSDHRLIAFVQEEAMKQ